MKIKKIYLDTSVIGGSFDEEFKGYSDCLFALFEKGYYIPVVSQVTIEEISKAPEKIIKKLQSMGF